MPGRERLAIRRRRPADGERESPVEPIAGAFAAEAASFQAEPDAPSVRLEPRSIVARRYPVRDSAIRRSLGVADIVAVILALPLAAAVAGVHAERLPQLIPVVLAFPVIFKLYGLYDRDLRRIAQSWIDDIPRVFHAVLVGSLLLWGAALVLQVYGFRALATVTFAVAAFVLVPLLRVIARRAALRRLGPERVLLVGDDTDLDFLVRKIAAHPEYQLDPIGFLSHSKALASARDLPVFGNADEVDLPSLMRECRVGRVILSRRGLHREDVVNLIRTCNEMCVKVSYLPQVFEGLGPSTEVDHIEGVTVLGLNPPVMTRSSRAIKRGMDLVGALCLLVVLAPAMLAIAVAVKLDSTGPVLFRQQRIGRSGRRFQLVKFRTMVVDAEKLQSELLARSQDPHWLLLDRDPRVTRLGSWLRHTSLDELPQLFNVLKGEMSLVGPRPIIESEDRQLEGWRRNRVDLTPGLTGMWQVLGRTSIPFEDMIKLDYLYVTNWSLWTDVRLILLTGSAVRTRRGAN